MENEHSANDQRSNVKNSNNEAHAKDLANRAKQALDKKAPPKGGGKRQAKTGGAR